MARQTGQYGGFNEEFVGEVKDELTCQICTKPFRDPHLTVCCGHNFCESCLKQWSAKHREQCCPFCRSTGEEFQHILDKRTKREINALKVRCSNREKGCEWVGELGALKGHLDAKDGCGYVEVACPNACESYGKMMRKDLQLHLKVECEKRPYQCEHCSEKGTFIQITVQHYRCCPNFPLDCPNMCGVMKIKRIEIDQHCKKCPLEKLNCPFKEVGCHAVDLRRKDEAEHMEKNVVNHQLLMLKSSQKEFKIAKDEWDQRVAMIQKESKRAKDECDQRVAVIVKNLDSLLATCTDEQRFPLQSICSVIDDSYCLKLDGDPLALQITNFSKYKRSNRVWYSPPFYLGNITGLKLRLAVYPNGIKNGAGSHVSLIIECLERDLKEPKAMMCCSFIRVQTGHSSAMDTYVCSSDDICECKNSQEIWASAARKGGFYCHYRFLSQEIVQILCSNDTLKLQTTWLTSLGSYDNVFLNILNCHCVCHIHCLW